MLKSSSSPEVPEPQTQVQDSQDVLQDVKNLPGFHLRTEVSHLSVNMTLRVVFLKKGDLWPDLLLVHYLLQLSSVGLGGFSSKASALGKASW